MRPSPKLHSIVITPDIQRAVWKIVSRQLIRYATQQGAASLSISEAKEVLALATPEFLPVIPPGLISDNPTVAHQHIGVKLHRWLQNAVSFFRRQGAVAWLTILGQPDIAVARERMWKLLFQKCLLPQFRDEFAEQTDMEDAELLLASMQLWCDDMVGQVHGQPQEKIVPRDLFLSTEEDLSLTLDAGGGRPLKIFGRCDAVMLLPPYPHPVLVDYKFGQQGQIELQIAQLTLYMEMFSKAKRQKLSEGRLLVFRPEEDTLAHALSDLPDPIAQRVIQGFDGYIGNEVAVRRLAAPLKLALKKTPPVMDVNILLWGPGGVGKTELARRIAGILGLPLVYAQSSGVKKLDTLIERVDKTLADHGLESQQDGTRSGLPHYVYPPFVLFLDEAHELGKNSDAFLSLFEPSSRIGQTSKKSCDITQATLLLATTERGALPAPFLSRFRDIELAPYSEAEVAHIAELTLAKMGVVLPTPDPELYRLFAHYGRINPRETKERVKEFVAHHQAEPASVPLTAAALTDFAAHYWNTSIEGLTQTDWNYLTALQSGPKGIQALVQQTGASSADIETITEPFLIKIGAIQRSPKGRTLTAKGKTLLISRRTG
jgi:Holliday junction DNA helicase RuvB